jgi:transcription antitermination factor NusG|uniref:Uncharacterized protein n=1 Tax=Sipha flava TaxID=143950 RepID=A0A2S2R8S8_9HEMI
MHITIILFEILENITSDLDIDIKIPRLSNQQTNRLNHNVKTLEEYYSVSVFLSYLESLINSLESRFSQTKETPFEIGQIISIGSDKIKQMRLHMYNRKVYDLYKMVNFIMKVHYWNIIEKFTKINGEYNISYYLKDCELFPSIT